MQVEMAMDIVFKRQADLPSATKPAASAITFCLPKPSNFFASSKLQFAKSDKK